MKFRMFYLIGLFFLVQIQVQGQDKVHLTIYNNNLALVNETRDVKIVAGESIMEFPDVASHIIPASVLINVKNSPSSLQIIEQNYEYDLVDGNKIFDKYLDKEIFLQTEHSGEVTGTLLNRTHNDLVLQMPDGELLVMAMKEILSTRFSKLPEGLRTRPTLLWKINNSGTASRVLDVSYLTNNISWQAEYVGELNENDDKISLAGWVSIDNRSGKTYKNAKLKLIAGDINQKKYLRKEARMVETLMSADQPAFEEKSFFEYHLYSLKRPALVKDRQQKQIMFIEPTTAKVLKEYVYNGSIDARAVAVQIKFRNSEEDGLGMPLPAGVTRIYKADDDGSKIFLGEDNIKHTPKDEDIRLKIGNAFDIIGERKELYNNKLSKRSNERAFEISLRNHKKQAIEVRVIERFHGDWRITESSLPVKEKTADKAEWLVKVPANKESKLTFVIRSQW
ncbi:MAG: DUF4139 domain-containing protein [Calditrichaeota bacterium]|nr:MAG: DUF4139 domain-containing protein [Calditrichota bacterium]